MLYDTTHLCRAPVKRPRPGRRTSARHRAQHPGSTVSSALACAHGAPVVSLTASQTHGRPHRRYISQLQLQTQGGRAISERFSVEQNDENFVVGLRTAASAARSPLLPCACRRGTRSEGGTGSLTVQPCSCMPSQIHDPLCTRHMRACKGECSGCC